MKDELTFYRCDPKTLEEKVLPRDMIEGTELAGHLERQGEHLGTIYLNSVRIGDIFQTLEEISGAPYRYLMGAGERKLEPSGPVTYCARHLPGELGEFVHHINQLKSLKSRRDLSDAEREHLQIWLDFEKDSGLSQHDPGALDTIRKFLSRFRQLQPELISVYTRW